MSDPRRASHLSSSATELVAQAIHSDYVRRRLIEGTGADDPSLTSWESLPEALRDSNRDQAMDMERKVAAIGCELVPSDSNAGPVHVLTDVEVEFLGELEHERWYEERRRAGWAFGPAVDVDGKRSPYMLPWNSLPEDVRDLDRDAVRAMPRLVALAGLEIRRA